MKVIISILILSGILFQTTAKLAILINFQINRDYIAKNLCVNRKKPDSCCQGSCHLTKQLEEEEKKENAPTTPDLKGKFELMPFTILIKQNLAFSSHTQATSFNYVLKKYSAHLSSVFQPPDFTLKQSVYYC